MFCDNAFINDVQEQRQSISYCKVNAYHQKSKAERRSRDLQVQVKTMLVQIEGRTMLIHAIHQWKDPVEPQMWPYATRIANKIIDPVQDQD